MARSLHGNILKLESNAFFEALAHSLPDLVNLQGNGVVAQKARRLHTVFLPLYIMKRNIPVGLISDYHGFVFSHAIESEILFSLGMKNAASALLRLATEAAIKFLYYEYHPIENLNHHAEGSKGIDGLEYRNFLYSFPGLSNIEFMQRGEFEKTWSRLCSYAHGDIRAIEKLSIVEDLRSLFQSSEKDFSETISFIRVVNRTIITLLFAVRHNWLENVELTLSNAVFDDFTPGDKSVVRRELRIE